MRIMVVLFVLATAAVRVEAQTLPVGERVRISGVTETGAQRRWTGRLIDVQEDSILLIRIRRSVHETVRLGEVQQLQVSQGHSSFVRGTVRGAALGFAAGAVLGLVGSLACLPGLCILPPDEAPVLIGIVGTVPGAVVGMVTRREYWAEHPLPRRP